jgi:hypothetical protein
MNLSKVRVFLQSNIKILVPIAIFALAGILFLYFSSNPLSTDVIKREDHQPKTAITFKNNAKATDLSLSKKQQKETESINKKGTLNQVDDYLPPSHRKNKDKKQTEENKDENALETLHMSSEGSDEHISLIAAPFGRLLSCETILTIDSSNTETPIIGLVTEDLWYEGKLIIPAGTEVHGSAQAAKNRDRIVTGNDWILVWGSKDDKNGMELPLKAIALDKDKNDSEGTWSMIDGAAGLKGNLLKADELAEMKLFGATFLGGVISAIQHPGGTKPYGEEKPNVVKTSFSTAVSQGVSAVIERYAAEVMEAIEKEGFFVRITAGKQFYLYIQQSIDLALLKKMK